MTDNDFWNDAMNRPDGQELLIKAYRAAAEMAEARAHDSETLADLRARLRDLRDQWMTQVNQFRNEIAQTGKRSDVWESSASHIEDCASELDALLVDPLTPQE